MTRQFYDDDFEGVTEGLTVYETDDRHPRLLGPDGEPLLTTDIAQMDHITTRIGRYGYRGEEISVETRAGELYIAGAQVVAGDLMASNGIVHGIDTAVIPQAASDQ